MTPEEIEARLRHAERLQRRAGRALVIAMVCLVLGVSFQIAGFILKSAGH